jgi:hypothetical protein
MVRCFLLLSLFLTGCDWFKGPTDEHDVYTAEFELVEAEPNLNPCDGVRVIPYRVKKCFRNGFETSPSNCSGLIKLPKEFKSIAGDLEENILNYKDEVIGTKTYTCSEGEEKTTARQDVSCSDSRYIKQIQDGIPDCNPYFLNGNSVVSSEMRLQKQVDLQPIYNSRYNFEVPGVLNRKFYDYNTNLFYKINPFASSLELETSWNQKPFKTFDGSCIFFTDNTYTCISFFGLGTHMFRNVFFDQVDEYFNYGGSTICVRKQSKYFCAINNSSSIVEIPELETADKVYILNKNICYLKNSELFCTGKFIESIISDFNNNAAENINFQKIFDEEPLIIRDKYGNRGGICLINVNNELYCIGLVLENYYPNFTKMTNWPFLKDFNMELFIGIGLDNKAYQFGARLDPNKSIEEQGSSLKIVEEIFIKSK